MFFPNPGERIVEYYLVEVYARYNDCHNIANEITGEDIRAADGLYAGIDHVD